MILPLQVYPSLYHAIVMMYSENGIRTFYKGMPYMTEMRSILNTNPGITTGITYPQVQYAVSFQD